MYSEIALLFFIAIFFWACGTKPVKKNVNTEGKEHLLAEPTWGYRFVLVGDFDGNGSDEIGLVGYDAYPSNLNTYRIFTYKPDVK